MSLGDAPSLAATAFNSSAESGKGGNASASFARSTEAPCQYSEYARVLAAILTVEVRWPAGAAVWSRANTGSPKPIIGFVLWPLRANTRKAFRLATDGSTVTACRFTSQAASWYVAISSIDTAMTGLSITSRWNGNAVSGPEGTMRSWGLSLISASTGPNSATYNSCAAARSNSCALPLETDFVSSIVRPTA